MAKLRFIQGLKQEFESGSGLTPQFSRFYREFKTDFTKLLKREFNAQKIEINRGHFEINGFFQLPDGRIYYFSLGDVRWSKTGMLVRTATSFGDFAGGINQYARTSSQIDFVKDLKIIIW